MINNVLKVYGEDLVNAEINQTNVAGDKVVAAGQTAGALCVNVFAKGEVSIASDVTVTVKHGDSENGSFAELFSLSIEAEKTFADGELMATATLPQDTKAYVTAEIISAADNSGKVRVTLGYLAR